MALSWRREDLGWMSEGSSLLWEWWGTQRGCGCPIIPGGVQGQVGWGPGQPGLVLDVEVGGPACGRGVGASWSLGSLPTRLFRDSVILWSLCAGNSLSHQCYCTWSCGYANLGLTVSCAGAKRECRGSTWLLCPFCRAYQSDWVLPPSSFLQCQ